MATKKANKKTEIKERIKVVFRFLDESHHKLITCAADDAGLSLNSWIVQATLKQARDQFKIK